MASKWGKTDRHYREMVELHNRYRERGFNILAFPCNQFLSQEPGTNEQIKEFVRKYNVEFDMFNKVRVNGKDAHPLFKFLRLNSNLEGGKIGWNFGKFLINRELGIVRYFGPGTNPLEMVSEIEALLWVKENQLLWMEQVKAILVSWEA